MDNENNPTPTTPGLAALPNELEEMMAIEIHFGKGRKDVMLVHFGDKPDELAKEFIKKHNLKASAEAVISQHISNTIEEFRNANVEIRPQSPAMDDQARDEVHGYEPPTQSGDNSVAAPAELPLSPPKQIINKESYIKSSTDNQGSPPSSNHTALASEYNEDTDNIRGNNNYLTHGSPEINNNRSVPNSSVYDQTFNSVSNFGNSSSEVNGGFNNYDPVPSSFAQNLSATDSYGGYTQANDGKLEARDLAYDHSDGNYNNGYSNGNDYDNYQADGDYDRLNEDFGNTTLNEEELFNRMKDNFNPKIMNTSSISHLKPSSNTLSMSKSVSAHGKSNAKKLVGKTANERLYLSAVISEEKLQKMREYERKKIEAEKLQQFKLTGKSKQLASKMSSRCSDVGTRLYDDGLKERERRIKLAEDKNQQRDIPKTWSCSRCATEQAFNRSVASNGLINSHAGGNKENKICKKCGWNQGLIPEFTPVNVAIKLAPDEINAEEMLRNRFKGNKEGLGLFDFLHANPKQTAEKIARIKSEWEFIDHDITFKPSIPPSSKEIIQREAQKQKKSNSKPSTSLDLSAPDEADDPDDEFVVTKDTRAKYFQQPAHERLHRAQCRKTIFLPDDVELPPPPPVRSPSHVKKVVERLSQEYVIKEHRKQHLASQFYAEDHDTGQPLFQPVVPKLPTSLYNASKKKPTNIFKKLMVEHEQKMAKLESQDSIIDKKLKEQYEQNRATAIPKSDKILQNSLNHNIEETYRVLLASYMVDSREFADQLDYDSRAQLISEVSNDLAEQNWQSMQLDLGIVNFDLMIPEIRELIRRIREEMINQLNEEDPSLGLSTEGLIFDELLLTDFPTFTKFVMDAIKKRIGTGKKYLVAPRKRSSVVKSMIRQENSNYTFEPRLDPVSVELSKHRRRTDNTPVEVALMAEAKSIQARREAARAALLEKEAEHLPFKPTLIPAPKYVKPKYYGEGEEEGSVVSGGLDGPPLSSSQFNNNARSSQPERSNKISLTDLAADSMAYLYSPEKHEPASIAAADPGRDKDSDDGISEATVKRGPPTEESKPNQSKGPSKTKVGPLFQRSLGRSMARSRSPPTKAANPPSFGIPSSTSDAPHGPKAVGTIGSTAVERHLPAGAASLGVSIRVMPPPPPLPCEQQQPQAHSAMALKPSRSTHPRALSPPSPPPPPPAAPVGHGHYSLGSIGGVLRL